MQRCKTTIKKIYEFSKYYLLYSYGNDYDVILENLIINNSNSKYPKVAWKKKFYDFKNIIKKYTNIDPSKYSSGSI